MLQQASPELVREFQAHAFFTRIPTGRDVFVEGDNADAIALLLSGEVRVYKIGESGREITLYRFGHGGSCILTANAILSRRTFPAIATVEKDAEAIMIPADIFRDWIRRFNLWQDFFFELLSDRLSSVMTVVDEVVFQRMDRRIATWLLARSKTGKPIQVTHQEIAAELGSSREVISRMLEEFSREGLIQSDRGSIQILDVDGLSSHTGV